MSEHEKFLEIIRNGAQLLQVELKKGSNFYCVAHLDADGVTGAAVLTKVIRSHNGQINYRFTHSLRNDIIDSIAENQNNFDFLIFCDCGSTILDFILTKFPNKCILVIDHHKTAQKIPSNEKVAHINPWLAGIDGTQSISAGGLAYLVANQVEKHVEMSPLAVVAAIAEWQDSKGDLIGYNDEICREAEAQKYIKREEDIRLLGRQTYSMLNLLFISFPVLPSLTADLNACKNFLSSLNIDKKQRWIDLDEDKKGQFWEALKSRLKGKLPENVIASLYGKVYTLLKEQEGTMKRDAREFGFLINACGRRGQAKIGLEVCLKSDYDTYRRAVELFEDDTNKLFIGIKDVTDSINEKQNVIYSISDKIEPNLIGTVCSMVLSSRVSDPNKILICLAQTEDKIKFSARCHSPLVKKGINLGDALKKAANIVGGFGGGHTNSGGGYIKMAKFEDFLAELDNIIGLQLKK